VRNLVAHTEGGIQVDGVREQGAEEDIWAKAGRRNRAVEKTI